MKKLLVIIPTILMLYACNYTASQPPLYVMERNNSYEEVQEFCKDNKDACVYFGSYVVFVDEGYLFAYAKVFNKKYYMETDRVEKILGYKNSILVLKETNSLWLALSTDSYDRIHHADTRVCDVKVNGYDIEMLTCEGQTYTHKGTKYFLRTTTTGLLGKTIIVDNQDQGFFSTDRRVYIKTPADDEDDSDVFLGS